MLFLLLLLVIANSVPRNKWKLDGTSVRRTIVRQRATLVSKAYVRTQCTIALHKLLCTGKMSIQAIHTNAPQTPLSERKETFHKKEAHASCSLSVRLFFIISLCVFIVRYA